MSRRPDDGRRPDGGRSLGGALMRFFELLRDMEEEGRRTDRRSGRREGGFTIDYDYAVGIGDHPPSGSASLESESEPPVSVHSATDGVTVTVDLPGVDPDALAAGIRGRQLTVGAENEVLTRIRLPRDDLAVRGASFNNGVLEVTLTDEGTVNTDDN
ncbi:gas vesicle protein GvpH [Haloferacaceae archaeon DSL9]